jgi:hypothetical protein
MNNENGYSQKDDGYPLLRVVSPEILNSDAQRHHTDGVLSRSVKSTPNDQK